MHLNQLNFPIFFIFQADFCHDISLVCWSRLEKRVPLGPGAESSPFSPGAGPWPRAPRSLARQGFFGGGPTLREWMIRVLKPCALGVCISWHDMDIVVRCYVSHGTMTGI